jgi:hypothetical protein
LALVVLVFQTPQVVPVAVLYLALSPLLAAVAAQEPLKAWLVVLVVAQVPLLETDPAALVTLQV